MEMSAGSTNIVLGFEEEDTSNPNVHIDALSELKIKGDAIGCTMYSERYVLKTLLQLVDNESWNPDLEADLCCIWDMTTEKDVVDFLLTNNFIDLSISIVNQTTELRLIEIMVGIVGNMCVYPESSSKLINNSEFETILALITLTDTPILIQLMRLYKALLFCENIDYNSVLSEHSLNQINFILKSSQNTELLHYTMQVISEILAKKKSEILDKNLILDSVNEAFKEFAKSYHDDLCVSRDFEKCICTYIKILENMCIALKDIKGTLKYGEIIKNFNDTCVQETLKCISMILRICCDLESLKNDHDTVEYYIFHSLYFLSSFETPFSSEILQSTVRIFELIIDNSIVFESELQERVLDYLIDVINDNCLDVLVSCLSLWSKSKLQLLFVDNIVNKIECNFEFIEKINVLCR